jgi:hypothetical protein
LTQMNAVTALRAAISSAAGPVGPRALGMG